jgi:hypothetical protein
MTKNEPISAKTPETPAGSGRRRVLPAAQFLGAQPAIGVDAVLAARGIAPWSRLGCRRTRAGTPRGRADIRRANPRFGRELSFGDTAVVFDLAELLSLAASA